MTDEERIDEAIKLLVEKGVWKTHAYPPVYRLLRRFGVILRPPVFASKLAIALGFGAYFGAAWGLLMWLLGLGSHLSALAFASLVAGALFGACMAAFFNWQRNRYGLPTWEEIGAAKTETGR